MKLFLSIVVLAVVSWSECKADLPAYCGVNEDKFNYKPVPKAEGTLRQVHMAMRHGDRISVNASSCWAGDAVVWDCIITEAVLPVINRDQHLITADRLYRKEFETGREELPGNCALGQLTGIGFKQDALLGEAFKTLYVDSGFMSPNITISDYKIRSSDIYRTMQSVQTFLNAMFPPVPQGERASVMDIFTMDPTFDDIYPNANICPKLKTYEDELFKTPGFIEHYMNFSMPLIKDIQDALSNPSFGYVDLFHLFDCLNVHYCHEYDGPKGMTPELFERITDEMTWLVYTIYSYPSPQDFSRIGIGFLVKEMFEEVHDMMEGESKRKLLVYSGHDATIMPLLTAFNVSDGKWAPYSSYFVIEVYETSSENSPSNSAFSIRILYNGKVKALPFCDDKEMCDMTTVDKYLANITPVDRKSECY